MMAIPDTTGMLDGYRVLDLTDETGFLCGKVFADLGAEVIKVEPPGGDRARQRGPFAHDIVDPEQSLFWAGYNAGKQSLVLDLTVTHDRERFRVLASEAHFVIESFPPGTMDDLGIGYRDLRESNPALIFTSVTPFGQEGPYRDFVGGQLVAAALSGVMFMAGDEDKEPVLTGYPLMAYGLASLDAAAGALIAHYYRAQHGTGQHVDVSVQESLAAITMDAPLHWEANGFTYSRKGAAMLSGRGGWPRRVHWHCKDGFVAFTVFPAPSAIISAQGLTDWMRSEGFPTGAFGDADWVNMKFGAISREEMERLEEPVKVFFAAHTMAELYEGALQRRILLAPLVTVKEVVESPQLRAMDFWTPIEDRRRNGTLEYPTFLHASETSAAVRSAAPGIGEHTHSEVFNPSKNGIDQAMPVAVASPPSENGRGALAGLKVVDFGRSIVGPVVSRFLTLHGATVVRVESREAPDLKRLSGPFKDGQVKEDHSVGFSNMHCNKYGVTLNLKHPQGNEMTKKLLAWADVVVENYSVGTMEGLGLGYDELRRINPGLIMVSCSGQGTKGPHSRQPGWAMFMVALTGISTLTGLPSSDPSYPMAPFPDELPPRFAVAGLLAALDHRHRTGRGQHLELSQLESCVYLLAPLCFDYTMNGRVAQRQGNRTDWAAPHGVFRCKGDDRWCAIATTSEEQWHRLCDVLGKPEWANDERFATLESRKQNEDQLESLIGEWSLRHSPEEVMELLQNAGVPAGRVSNAEDLYNDAQLRFRQHLVTVEHPHMGSHSVEAPGFRLSATPACVERPGPDLGEHNELVFCQWLGVSGAEFVDLMEQGAFN